MISVSKDARFVLVSVDEFAKEKKRKEKKRKKNDGGHKEIEGRLYTE